MDCFYTPFKYRFCFYFLAENGKIFESVEEAVSFEKLDKEMDEMPSFANKGLFEKKFREHLLTLIQKSIAVELSGSIFVTRVERARRTKFELELMNFVDRFLGGYRSYQSKLDLVKKKTQK